MRVSSHRRYPQSTRAVGDEMDETTYLNGKPEPSSEYVPVWAVGILVFAVFITALMCGLDPAHIIRPLPAPFPPPTSPFIYLTGSAFVYAAELYENNSYVAVRWDVQGHVYNADGTFSQTVEACHTTPCSLLIHVNETDHVQTVLRFPGAIVQQIYANETQLVVSMQGLVGDGFVVPDAETASATVIRRDYPGVAGLVVVYTRETMTYHTSSLILTGEETMLVSRRRLNAAAPSWTIRPRTFSFNRAYMDDTQIVVAFHGACVGNWTITPQLIDHWANDTERDYQLPCDRQQAAVIIYSDLNLTGIWHVAAEEIDSEMFATVSATKADSTTYVYGAFVADSDGVKADVFHVPNWILNPAPGVLAVDLSSLELAWASGYTTNFVFQYDATLTYGKHLKFKTGTNNVVAHANTTHFSIYGETIAWTSLNVFDFSVAESDVVGTMYDDTPEYLSPVGCVWNSVTGSLLKCWLYTGTSNAVVSAIDPELVITVKTVGTLRRSDPWLIGANLTYTENDPVVVTDVDSDHSKSVEHNGEGRDPDVSNRLPKDKDVSDVSGHVVPCEDERWYGEVGGVKFNKKT